MIYFTSSHYSRTHPTIVGFNLFLSGVFVDSCDDSSIVDNSWTSEEVIDLLWSMVDVIFSSSTTEISSDLFFCPTDIHVPGINVFILAGVVHSLHLIVPTKYSFSAIKVVFNSKLIG
ncbi:hypothetical protein [Crucivirus-539]|nr:hypothetical protein [Crucivirus-539]